MTSSPVVPRKTSRFETRGEALGVFFERAGDSPRYVSYEEDVGCPLHTALSVLEWAGVVGILKDDDLLHAARLSTETAAAMVERTREGRRIYMYMGPRMDAPPADPQEGTMVFDEPGVRGYEFVQRAHALAHFLRATQGVGAVLSFLSRRAPEVRHVKRWIGALFEVPVLDVSNNMLAGWFSTTAAGVLFTPSGSGDPYVYHEIGETKD